MFTIIRFWKSDRERIFLGVILTCGALALYLGLIRLFPLGYFTDDALYVVLSKGLCRGVYEAIHTSASAPITDPLPGYPLLLCPWVLLFKGNPLPLKLFSICLTLGSGWAIFGLIPDKTVRWLTFVFFLFNATTVRYSGIIMGEPAFLACSLLSLVWFEKKWKGGDSIAGVLLGLACLIRPQGIFFVFAMALHLWFMNESKHRAMKLIGIPVVLLTGILARNYWIAGEMTGYLTNLFQHKTTTFHVYSYAVGLKKCLGHSIIEMVFQIPGIGSLFIRKVVGWTLVIGTISLILSGYFKNKKSAVFSVGFYFVLFNVFFLPLWFAEEQRYFYLMAPWLVMMVCQGFFDMAGRRVFPLFSRGMAGLLLFAWFSFQVRQIVFLFQEVKSSQYGSRDLYLNQTLNWVRMNAGKEDVVLSNVAPLIFLATGRLTSNLMWSPALEKDPTLLGLQKIEWVLLSSPEDVAGRSESLPHRAIQIVQRWAQGSNQLELAYCNKGENTVVYKVLPRADSQQRT